MVRMSPRPWLTAALAVWPLMAPADAARGVGSSPLTADALEALRWQARPVVVLGPAPDVAAQIKALQAQAPALAERGVTILTDGPGAARFDPDGGFRVLLIGKDGGVKMDERRPVTPDRIVALIDSMPMRQAEER